MNMPDLIHKLLKFIDHNRYVVSFAVVALVLVLSVSGCQATVASPISGESVTKAQLTAEAKARRVELRQKAEKAKQAYEAELSTIEAEGEKLDLQLEPAYAEIERRQEAVEKALGVAAGVVRTVGGPYTDLLISAIGIGGLMIGGGAVADNRRKDKVIRQQKEPAVAA